MSEHIVGMMWNKNEGDILIDTISSALEHVDTLVIADDGSTDNSWDIIQSFAIHHKDQIEHIQRAPSKNDPAQRQALLNVIQSRYRPEDTWVQILESDITIMETDVRRAIKERCENGVYVDWSLLNGVINPKLDWDEFDTWPVWPKPIQEILNYGHWLEIMTYTFRPFNALHYDPNGPWRPWPKGFSNLDLSKKQNMTDYTPLLAHYGLRGPTHFHKKYFSTHGNTHRRYPMWDLTSPEAVKRTVYYFNGLWNSNAFLMSRKGYKERKGAKYGN